MSVVVQFPSGGKDGTMTPLDQRQALEQHLSSKGLSAKTVQQRVGRMRRLQEAFGDLSTVTQHDLAEWLGQYSGNTRLTYHSDLVCIFDWLILVGLREDHPVRGATPDAGIKKPPTPDARPHPLTRAEEARILAAASGDVYTWFILAFRAGLRAHEIAKIDGRDVNEDQINIVGKHGIVADVPTPASVWDLAQDYPRRGPWFDVNAKQVSRRCASLLYGLGMRGGIHRARATFGTRLVEDGVPLSEVRVLMRHRSLASTQHYLGTNQQRLRSAIDALDGAA